MFAIGEHHQPPFFSSSPDHAAGLHRGDDEKADRDHGDDPLITTNDPVRIAEEYAMLQRLSKGRMDLMLGRGNTGPVYHGLGQDIRQGLPLALDYNLLRPAVASSVDADGKFRRRNGSTWIAATRRRAPLRSYG